MLSKRNVGQVAPPPADEAPMANRAPSCSMCGRPDDVCKCQPTQERDCGKPSQARAER